MKKKAHKLGAAIPELKDVITRYGCGLLKDKPPFVLVGQYNSKEIGPTMGILAAANNEFHAYVLRREIRKNGQCDIEYTEHHPEKTTFSIEDYVRMMREKMQKKKQEVD